MGKVVKAVGIGAVVGAVAIASGGIGAGFLGGLTASVGGAAAAAGIGLSAIAAGAVAGGLIGAGLMGLQKIFSPSIKDVQAQSGQKFAVTSTTDTRKIVYGECRIGGTQVFIDEYDSNGADDVPNDTLVFIRAVADHEVEGFGQFYLGDKEINFDGSGNATTSPYAGKLYLKTYDGSQTSGADPWATAADSSWNISYVGEGVAYYVVKAVFDPDVFAYGASDLLNCSIIVQGKKIYDPRLDSTQTSIGGSGAHRIDDISTHEYSTNTALCVYDYLRDARLGNPVPASEIDVAEIAASANECDESVTVEGGETIPRYTLNGVVDSAKPKLTNIDEMLSAMAGRRMWLGGKFYIFAGAAVTATISINDDNIVDGTYDSLPPTGSRFNEVRGTFIDPDNNYEQQEYPAQVDATAQSDEGEVVHQLHLPFTRDHREAQRLAKIRLEQSSQPTLSLVCKPSAARVAPNDVMSVTYTALGLSSENFRVVKQTISPKSGLVSFELLKEDPAIYAWDEESDEIAPLSAPLVTSSTGLEVITPANVVVTPVLLEAINGAQRATLEITWDDPGPYVVETVVDYREDGDTVWIPGQKAFRGDNNVTLDLLHSTTWDIRVRHIMTNGQVGTAVTDSDTTDAASTGASIDVFRQSSTPVTSGTNGSLWWNTSTSRLYILRSSTWELASADDLSDLDSSAWSKLDGIETGATVGADSSNLEAGPGVNLLRNSLFLGRVFPWERKTSTHSNYLLGISGVDLLTGNEDFSLQGGGTLAIREGQLTSSATYDLQQKDIPVLESTRYEASIFMKAHRAGGAVYIEWYNTSDSLISTSTVNSGYTNSGTGNAKFLEQYERRGGFVTSPSGAVTARFRVRKTQTLSSTISWLFITQAYFGEAYSGQTELSSWTPGSLQPFDDAFYMPTQSVAGVYTIATDVGSRANPCSAYDNGASARIDIDSFTLTAGSQTVEYNSGSITSLSFNTGYHVYAFDPSLLGDATQTISYSATTDRTAIPANTVYLGFARTPLNGGTGLTGTAGGLAGGGGAYDPDLNEFTTP